MTLSEKDIQLVEDAILDRLTQEDALQFDIRKTDSEFAAYHSEQHLISEVIKEKGRNELKGRLKLFEQSVTKNKSNLSLFTTRRILLIAASILLIVFVYNIIDTNQTDYNSLYAEYNSPYPNLIDPITKGSTEDNPSAYQLYELGRYQEALSMFRELEPSDDTEWYIMQSELAIGNAEEASKSLDKILQNESHSYYQDAQFTKVLIHLKSKNIEESILMLKQISSSDKHPYKKRAIELLKKL